MDQALLNDAINAAGDFPNGSVYDWPSVYNEKDNGAHPFWHDEHNRGEISNRNVPGKRWYRAEYTCAPPRHDAPPSRATHAPSAPQCVSSSRGSCGR